MNYHTSCSDKICNVLWNSFSCLLVRLKSFRHAGFYIFLKDAILVAINVSFLKKKNTTTKNYHPVNKISGNTFKVGPFACAFRLHSTGMLSSK